MNNFFSAQKQNQQHSNLQVNSIFQSEQKKSTFTQSTASNGKSFYRNLNFTNPLTPSQSRVQERKSFQPHFYDEKFSQMLMKIKLLEAKSQKVKQNNQKSFTQFKSKLNNLTKTHQKYCQNALSS